MGISNTFSITGTALNAQSIYLDVVAKNMANSQVVSSTEEGAFKAKIPVFKAMMESGFNTSSGAREVSGVKVDRLAESRTQIEKQRQPEHPLADDEGYIYLSNVNMVEEMANMMQASRTYQSNIEVLNTSKQLMVRTLSLGS